MKTIRVPAMLKMDLGMFWLMSCATGVVCLVFTAAPAFPQVSGALLSGTITDSSDAAVARAQVVIRNVSTGIERKTVSDGNGVYNAPNLTPGIYDVTVQATGFTTERLQGIVLNVGATKVVDSKLHVGQVTEQVDVQDVAPLLQLGSSETTAIVDSQTVRELPLNGRSWTDLAALQPGVVRLESSFNYASGFDRGLKGFGTQLSISGGRPVQNNYRIDGLTVNDYSNGGPSNVIGGALGVDAIQEFSVITSNYTAQYGRTSGGVVNAITKSGTNTLHGSAYEFIRNSALDARNYFDFDVEGNPDRPPFRRNQFGGSLGGPISRGRTFIFGDYEGIRQSKGIATQALVPSLAARAGNLTTGPVKVDPAAAKYLTLYPRPNLSTGAGDTGIYSFTDQQVLTENFFTTRIDEVVSEKNSLSGSYIYDDTPYSAPDHMNITLKGHHIRRQSGVLEGTHLFSPTLLNSVHVGVSRVVASINSNRGPINPLSTDKSFAAIPGDNAARVFIPNVTTFPGGVAETGNLQSYTSAQGYDDAILTRGAHSLKFGVAVENIRSNVLGGRGTGDWAFASLRDFLINQPLSFQASKLNTVVPRNVRSTIFGAYLQDNWRIRKALTVDLGLRYEMSTVPQEVNGRYVTLLNLTDAQAQVGGQLFHNPTLRNFEPRLGFAWDPRGDSKTVVHGAFGMFDVLPLPYVMALVESQAGPANQVASVTTGLNGAFYTGGYSLLNPLTNSNSAFVEQHPHRNYVMTWNLNVQRQITENLGVIIGYVGSRGLHQQFKVDDSDMALPTLTSAGYVFPFSATTTLPTLNPNFGDIRSLWWNGSSSYHSLQVGATKRMSKGVQFQGSFTWQKSLDSSSSGAGSDSYANSLSSLHWYDQRLNKSVSDFNTPRVLTLSTVWEVPAGHLSAKIGQKLLDGWQLGGILTAQDGQPFTVLIGGDPLGQNSSDPFAFPNRVTGPGCNSLVNPGNINQYIKVQCFSMPTAPNLNFWNANCNPAPPTLVDSNGNQITLNHPQNPALDGAGWLPALPCFNLRGNARRNILAGPGLVNLDFSIYKNTRISEKLTTQFRAEFFNVVNRANFQSPLDNNALFDPTGAPQSGAGVIDQTANDSREVQFALKFLW
jgi:Carboxypeptidase regulatory-like domain/TonB-dependent Receptor Plug Domain